MGFMSRRFAGLSGVLMLSVVLGCGPQRPVEEASEQSREMVDAAATKKLGNVSQDHALVQVLIYGLAAFEFEPNFTTPDPDKVTAHMPVAFGHEIELHSGKKENGQPQWNPIIEDDNGDDLDIEGKTISFSFGNTLKANHKAGAIGDYPAGPDEAEDARWIIPAKRIDTFTHFDRHNAETHIEFEGGVVETCGLVHDKTMKEVCRVEVLNNGFARSASEYMVVRHLVPIKTSEIEVVVKGEKTQTVSLGKTGGDSITWNSTTYTEVFDVRVRNATSLHLKRKMKTAHADYLKPLFRGATKSWELVSPDCEDIGGDNWICNDCKSGRQPSCLKYFLGYLGGPSGSNRPICPFVEYP